MSIKKNNPKAPYVVTLGGAVYDIFMEYKNINALQQHTTDQGCFLMLEEGKKIEIESLSYYSGGGATNAAVSFKRLGFSTKTIVTIGADKQGDFILEELKKEGVDIDAVHIDPIHPTAQSFIIPCPSGDRIIFVHRGANKYLTIQQIPLSIFQSTKLLYITSLAGESSQLLKPVTKEAYTNGATVAINPGSSQLAERIHDLHKALPYTSILIMNRSEAIVCMQSLNPHTSSFNLSLFCKTVMDLGPSIVVVTDGAHGVSVAHENTLYFHPSIPTSVASTLGAGDAFGSCFTASITAGNDIPTALRHGLINSSSVISTLDAKSGLLTRKQLESRLQQLPVDDLQVTSL